MILKTFYETRITLIPKPHKNILRKKTISLKNMNTKTCTIILATWIHQYVKSIINHEQMHFIPEQQSWFNNKKFQKATNCFNRLKKKSISSSHWMQKNIWQNSVSPDHKNPTHWKRTESSQLIKGIYVKSIATIFND